MSCNPALQLRFSFLPKWVILLWIAGVLAARRDIRHVQARHSGHCAGGAHTYVRTLMIYIYIPSILVYLARKWATTANGLALRLGSSGTKVSDRMPVSVAADANTVE